LNEFLDRGLKGSLVKKERIKIALEQG